MGQASPTKSPFKPQARPATGHHGAGFISDAAIKLVIRGVLPPYSPDMNPIEMAFSKLKALLRQNPQRTIDALWRQVGALLDRFLPQECANYFRAAGYPHSM